MSKKAKKKNKTKGTVLTIILTALITTIGMYVYNTYTKIDVNPQNYETQRTLSTEKEQTVENVEQKSQTIANTLEQTMESVVGISKLKDAGSSIFSTNTETTLGLGTGIIISENGYILSNEHVTGTKYSTCYITLENSKKYDGTVVWSDSDLDLSITKIEANNLKYITLGDSSKIRIGETVYAIGNPIGVEFQRTVTSGIISGVNRTIKIEEENNESYMEDLVQTDATINPGNSGGPLINTNGEVIGVNTVKINEAEGIGFAVPINIVKPIIESFVRNGNFEEAYLGIFAYDKNVVPYLETGIEFGSGIYVAQINKDGPANTSNLKVGDIITKIDDIDINKMSELRKYIYSKKAGDEVNLIVLRNKKTYSIKIKLGKK